MKKNQYFLNTALAVVLGIACVIAVLVRTFAPAALIPGLDIPNMAALSLATLLVDHYAAKGAKRCYICIPVFSVLTFGLLPFAACFVGGMEALKLGITGALNRENACTGAGLWICDDGFRCEIIPDKRVGIGYAAQEDQDKLWRFKMGHQL